MLSVSTWLFYLLLETFNGIPEQIGRWHDAEFADIKRHISPLQPHRLRHTFGNELAKHPALPVRI
jgi:hypothetical protein